jgi:CxxC motif-containing protein
VNHRHDRQPQPQAIDEDVATHVYLCTGCPLGCRLEVDAVDDEVVEVRGFNCRKGDRYGRQEHLDPRRPLSTTIWIEGAAIRRVPVRTAEPVPRDQLVAVVEALRGLRIAAPVKRGEVVVADVLGTGIDVIVTRELPAVGQRDHLTTGQDPPASEA